MNNRMTALVVVILLYLYLPFPMAVKIGMTLLTAVIWYGFFVLQYKDRILGLWVIIVLLFLLRDHIYVKKY